MLSRYAKQTILEHMLLWHPRYPRWSRPPLLGASVHMHCRLSSQQDLLQMLLKGDLDGRRRSLPPLLREPSLRSRARAHRLLYEFCAGRTQLAFLTFLFFTRILQLKLCQMQSGHLAAWTLHTHRSRTPVCVGLFFPRMLSVRQ